MNIIDMTRALGAALQDEEAYLQFVAANRAVEEDASVSEKMSTLQSLQAAYQEEMQKETQDAGKMEKMDLEFQNLYQEMMQLDSMVALNSAKAELNDLLHAMTQILVLCANGEDPATCEPGQSQCGGGCGSCGGGCGGGSCACN